jgi:hypothetical protein
MIAQKTSWVSALTPGDIRDNHESTIVVVDIYIYLLRPPSLLIHESDRVLLWVITRLNHFTTGTTS